jgi:hypothetical protein
LGLYDGKQSKEDKQLKHKYESLKYTRLELHRSSGHEEPRENECTFAPQISERSKKLASSGSKGKRVNRYRYPQCGVNINQALTDRINVSVMCEEKTKISIEDYNDENLNVQNEEPVALSRTDISGNKRSQILYDKAKEKSIGRRINKTREDIEYEKNVTELTFKPKITKNKSTDKLTTLKYAVRGEKNTISRMIRGRVEREVRRIINEKGVPYNEKLVDRMRKEKYEEMATPSTKSEDTVLS